MPNKKLSRISKDTVKATKSYQRRVINVIGPGIQVTYFNLIIKFVSKFIIHQYEGKYT